MPSLILRAAQGGNACCSSVAEILFRRVAALSRDRLVTGPSPHLTRREAEVLRVLADGLSNKEIARALCIELSTVKNHVHRIFEKLGVRDRADAGAWLHAHDMLLTSLPCADGP
jgi:DNA-binding NarL/FixJ family response regulator